MSRVLDLQHGRQGWVRLSLGSFTWFWLSPGSLSLTISSRVRNSPCWTFISPTCLFICFILLSLLLHSMLCGMQDLSSLIKDQTCALCNGVLTTGPPGKCHYLSKTLFYDRLSSSMCKLTQGMIYRIFHLH